MSILETLTEGIVNRDMKQEGTALLNKWTQTGLLEGLEGQKAQNMAVLLENQAKQLLKESSSMGAGDVSGNHNIALGASAMDALTTGACNIAIGINALGAATTGCGNIAIGDKAMQAAVACGGSNQAEFNIAIGVCAGCSMSTTSCTTAIGWKAGRDVTTEAGVTNIGFMTNSTTAATTCIAGGCVMAAQFTATSDCRSKKNIKDLPYGLDFINLLRPVSYKWKPQADKLDKDGNLIEEGECFHTHQRTMFGLLGQQVKESLTKLGLNYNDFAGYQDKEEEHGPSGWTPSYTEENKTVSLAYDDFIAPLIKSVQELSAEVDSLKAQLKTA